MRVLDGDRILVRIYLGESDRYGGQPLWRALLERLRREGFAGSTLLHGVAGFGARSVVHTSSVVDLSGDLPVVVEVVDDDAHIERLTEILDEMMQGGLVTVEKVRVLRYRPSH
jgi:PII-like signaling protein